MLIVAGYKPHLYLLFTPIITHRYQKLNKLNPEKHLKTIVLVDSHKKIRHVQQHEMIKMANSPPLASTHHALQINMPLQQYMLQLCIQHGVVYIM